MTRNLCRLGLACAFVASALVGCDRSGGERASGKGEAGGEGKLAIAVIPKSTGAEFWETVEEGARDAAKALGVDMKWEGTQTEADLPEQTKIIENMVNLGVDGIALAPLNNKAQRKPVESAVAAGIPVVIFDSAVDGDAHSSFVATDNKLGGVLGARHLGQVLGGKGKVMVMRFIQGTASTEARAAGFLEAAKEAGLEVAADPWGETATVDGCKRTASNTLEGFIADGKLQLDGIFACNDRATLGMLAALEDVRKSGIEVKTRFVGFDFTPKLVDSLQKGEIEALVVQDPKKMGYLAVETLVKHLRGEPVEKFIDTGVEVATRERLQKEPALRKLVGLVE